VEWIFFALGVAVIAVIGVGVGLLVARRVAGRAERRTGGEDSAFMTPVGPPPDEEGFAADRDGADEGARDG
jgi:hypothetical protein